jgi:PAS domain S-box-containing protein
MLSASATEVRTGHEAAVRAFAESFADTRGDGFFETNRSGVIAAINGKAAQLLGQDASSLVGKTLNAAIAPHDVAALKEFLERPARFAETARPCVSLRGAGAGAEILLFAQGQAGTVTGYFGFVRAAERHVPVQISGQAEVDPALLARISRGVRRPLNTIIGFSDLITRLRDGRYLPQRASIDLTGLLESCVVRIRNQASNSRVIVRNAISERLPKVTADRASLAQAVLNLLASAIDQTPAGGAVVISAQREEDGGISIHVRDSSTNAVDLAERFVVFRDGTGRDGHMLAPVRSSVGLALTRSLLAVNAFSLSVDPAGSQGLLFSLLIPADLVSQS